MSRATESGPTVRLLEPGDAQACLALRREALVAAPLAFASSLDDAAAPTLESVARSLGEAPRAAVFGYFADRLCGMVGLYRDFHVKAAHKAHMWGMYVAPDGRRRGAGRALLDAVIAHAAALPGVERIELGVSDDATEARALYAAAGFVAWAYEADALRFADRSTGIHSMSLRVGEIPRR